MGWFSWVQCGQAVTAATDNSGGPRANNNDLKTTSAASDREAFESDSLAYHTISSSPPRSPLTSLNHSRPSTPLSPRASDLSGHNAPSIFQSRFDALTPNNRKPTASSSSAHKSGGGFKDFKAKKIDPLRYTNRLEEPRRLPNTPTKSHLPPKPRENKVRRRCCELCGRRFLKERRGNGMEKKSGREGALEKSTRVLRSRLEKKRV